MVEDIRIPVKVGGVTFKNPFYVASGPTTKNVRQLQRIEDGRPPASSCPSTLRPTSTASRVTGFLMRQTPWPLPLKSA